MATMVEYGLEKRALIDICCMEQSVLSDNTLSEEDWIESETVFLIIKLTNVIGYKDSYFVQIIDEDRPSQK
jgi:hypothetical protein